jgi:DNA-binding PucR family transcriptional regulator
LPLSVRFIHFYSNQIFTNKAEFEEAILAFFHKEVILIWNSAREGVILEKIEEQPLNNEFLEHMQEIIAADLYHDVTFFVGKRYNPLSNLQLYFDIEHQCFKKSLIVKRKNNVLWFSKEMLYFILSYLPNHLHTELPNLLLNDMDLEDPILSTVKIYLQQNLNVTATSKKAFLHRNTVQYRLDKFSEQTGIDLKHFEDGLVIFLAIRLLEIVDS